MQKSWSLRGVLVATLAVALAVSEARADAIKTVTFTAGSQGFWGPGSSANSLNKGGRTGENAGVGFKVDASTGSVWGTYGGSLKLLGANAHDLASGSYSLDSSFTANTGRLRTSFGAQIDVYGFVGSASLSAPGFPKGNTLTTAGSSQAQLGGTPPFGTGKTFSGNTNFDILTFGIPYLAEVGPTFKVTQKSTFKPISISGTLRALHPASGTQLSRAYTVGDDVDLALGETGTWLLSLTGMSLQNTFKTGFDGAVGGFIDVIGLPRAELTTKNFDLFDGKSFNLNFGSQSWGNAMKLVVTDSTAQPDPNPQPAPEPGTIVLFGAVGAAVAYRRWRTR